MLGDVVDALRACRRAERVVVVTPDPDVGDAARALGAEARVADDPGLNAALDAAARGARRPGAARCSSCSATWRARAPATSRGSSTRSTRARRPRRVLAPSRDGGTSALLRRPPDAIPSCFGEDSAKAHRAAAEARRRALPRARRCASLAIDLDRVEDARALLASDAPRPAHARAARARARRSPLMERLTFAALRGVPAGRAGRRPRRARRGRRGRASGIALAGGVLVVCQKIVSKAEGRLVDLAASSRARRRGRIAAEDGKDPRHIEVILRETKRVVRRGHGVLICETRHGFVCANAGVDLSNAPERRRRGAAAGRPRRLRAAPARRPRSARRRPARRDRLATPSGGPGARGSSTWRSAASGSRRSTTCAASADLARTHARGHDRRHRRPARRRRGPA